MVLVVFLMNQGEVQVSVSKWSPPEIRCIKLNKDAATMLGVVCWCSSCRSGLCWNFVAARYEIIEPFTVDRADWLLACGDAILLAGEYGFQRVTLQTDWQKRVWNSENMGR
jgi:hypothetical protein